MTDPQPYDIWSGRGVHVQELYEVFPALRKPYYDPAPYDPLAYAAEIDAFVQAQLDADITHVFIDAAVGNIKYNQRRVDAAYYIDDAIQPLVDALHAAEIQVIGVQRLQDDTVVYGTERDQALTASARVQQFGMDSLLTWLPDNLTSARWRNRLNVYGGFLVYGEERSGVAPLEVPRGFCAPALPVEFPEYPWEQVFTGVPKFKSDDRLIWEYLNANYQVPRIEAESPVATINECVDAYAAGFWVDDPGDPNSTSPAAIWPALIATSATGAKVMEFEGKAASFAHSWSFWNLSELSADAAAYVYGEEPQEPPVEPPPATNPPDEVLFTVKIKGLPSGVTLRLRSTPTTAEAGNVVGMTWNDARFPVVDVAQDQNGKDWYCIGPKAPKSIWVASWYTAKV